MHRWASLLCAVFLLMLCLTGLPLIFEDELAALLSDDPPYADLPAGTPMANLDAVAATARSLHPDQLVRSFFIDDDEPRIVVRLSPSMDADPKLSRFVKFDARTGAVLREFEPLAQRPLTFLAVMLRLHRDLLADLPGALFLGAMGLLFTAATVSGVMLYEPFAQKIAFGTVRRSTRRIEWLDLHNLMGIVAAAWLLVVGLTGVLNELSQPLFLLWQRTEVAALLRPYAGRPMVEPSELAPVQRVFDAVRHALPDAAITSVAYPGTRVGSTPSHFLVWTKGASPLTSRLFNPALVNARTGELAAIVSMPWYLRALELARPLHFGDYGGLPLKVIWALLDLVSIAVIVSGLFLWLNRGRTRPDDQG